MPTLKFYQYDLIGETLFCKRYLSVLVFPYRLGENDGFPSLLNLGMEEPLKSCD